MQNLHLSSLFLVGCLLGLCLLVAAASGATSQPAVMDVRPTKLYSGNEQTLVVEGSSLEGYRTVGLGHEHRLPVLSIAFGPQADSTTLTLGVPADFPSGSYSVHLLGAGREPLETGFTVEVLPKLEVEVNSVTPQRVPRHRSSPVTFVIRGTGLDAVETVHVQGQSKCNGGDCKAVPASPSALRVTLGPSYRLFPNLPLFRLDLVDGSHLSLTPIKLDPPAKPWNWITTLLMVMLVLVTVISLMTGFHEDSDILQADQKAPDLLFVLRWLSRPLGAALLLGTVVSVVWAAFAGGFANVEYSFLGVSVLMGMNIGGSMGFAWLNGTFHDRPSRGLLLGLAATPVTAAAMLLPFLLTRFYLTGLALPLEGGIFVLVTLAGTSGFALAERRLAARRRSGPTDEELQVRIREHLREGGSARARNELKDLPRERVIQALETFYALHEDEQGLVFDRGGGMLEYRRAREVARVSAAFRQARSAAGEAKADEVTEIVTKEVWPALDIDVQPYPGAPDFDPLLRILAAAFPGVESVVPTPFPLLLLTTEGPVPDLESGGLHRILNSLGPQSRFAVLVTLGPGEEVARRLGLHRPTGQVDNVVVLDQDALLSILTARDELASAFVRVCREQISFSVFRPYVAEGPAKPDMFFGRKSEVQTLADILDTANAAILGARRIGKTSTVRAVQARLREQGKRIYYLDCYHIDSYRVFFSEIATRWAKDGRLENGRRLARPTDFGQLVMTLAQRYPGERPIFLFDEIDRLIAYDQSGRRGEAFFRQLRSLSQEKHCQFLFSGERTILDQLSNSHSCFFNFPSSIELGLLDRSTMERMVVEPTELLKVSIEEKAAVLDLVWSWTSGHPNLVQYLFSQVFDDLNRRQKRSIDLELVRTQVQRVAYRDRYIDTFWSQATATERAMSIVLADAGGASLVELFTYLGECGLDVRVDELERGLRYLRLSQLVEADGEDFKIRPERFHSLVRHFSVAEWLENLKVRIAAEDAPGAASG